MREDDRDWIGKPVQRLRLRRGAGLGGATLRSAGWQAWSRLRTWRGGRGDTGGSDVGERWVAGVEQATDMAWGPGGATLRSAGTYWDGPHGEPGMTLWWARCP